MRRNPNRFATVAGRPTSPPTLQIPGLTVLNNNIKKRRNSITELGWLLNYRRSNSKDNNDDVYRRSEHWLTKRIKRPIDFRFSGALMCSFFDSVDDLIFLYLSILSERRLIVVSSSLRYLYHSSYQF